MTTRYIDPDMDPEKRSLLEGVDREDKSALSEYDQAVENGELTKPGPDDPFDGSYAE